MTDDDAELAAIRARLRQEILATAAPVATPATETLDHPVDLDEGSLEGFVRAHENVVVDCWAPWCGPCRIVGPIVDQLAKEWAGRVAFGKVNVDTAPAISRAFGVQGIPTLLVFRQGRLVDRVVGALPKPQLAAMLERHLSTRRAGGSAGPRRA